MSSGVPKGPLVIHPLNLRTIIDGPRPQLDFLLPGLLRGTVGVLVGPGHVGKSWLVLQLLASVAVGKDVWRLIGEDPRPQHVALVSAEDPGSDLPDEQGTNVLGYRLHVLARSLNEELTQRYGVVRAAQALIDLADRLRVFPAYGTGLCVLDEHGRPNEQGNAFFENIAADHYSIIGVDTLRRVHRANENDNGAMAAVLGQFERVTRLGARPSVLLLHHISKGSASDEQTASRGASAITDNARWQANLAGMSGEEAKNRGIPDDERRRWVRYVPTKINYAANSGEVWLQRGEGGLLKRASHVPPRQTKSNARRARRGGTMYPVPE